MKTLLIAGLMLSFGAHAATPMFREQVSDARVEHIKYAENKVVRISAIVNQPFLIEFRDDELIEDVAGGSIAGWDVHKKGFRLYIRALDKAVQTTLIVTTHKHSYIFDLVKVKDTASNFEQRPSKIVFDFPPPPPVALPTQGMPPVIEPAKTPQGLAMIRRNENYTMQVVDKTNDIAPREVFDDGRFTWFKFSANTEIPVVYRGEPDSKEEVLIPSHMEGDYLVMHGLSPLWNLRLGKAMVGVFNENFGGQAIAPVNGTTVQGLIRESKQ